MSLDGAFLHIVKTELIRYGLIGSRVEKINQPARDEIILTLRAGGFTKKLLLNANVAAARVCLTELDPENPKTPPMFCILARKYFQGGRITEISQEGLERVLNFDFACVNEIGDPVTNRIAVEIMGRSSNIILLRKKDGVWRIIDSVKRVTDDISSVRRVLPNLNYVLPPRPERISLLDYNSGDILFALAEVKKNADCDIKLSKALLNVLEGVSPIFTRECAYYSGQDVNITVREILDNSSYSNRLLSFLSRAADIINNNFSEDFSPVVLSEVKDFCFVNINQYGEKALINRYESANDLLDKFFAERSRTEQIKQRSGSLAKLVVTAYERVARRLETQKRELAQCAKRDNYKIYGDLITANIYNLKKGDVLTNAENYLTGKNEEIKLNPQITPAQNAQKYYKEYKKLEIAEKALKKLIAEAEKELEYLDSVFDAVNRVASETGAIDGLSEIKSELSETGYVKDFVRKTKPVKTLPPLSFIVNNKYEILVGRNNIQNDKLTLKTAHPYDLWLHTQKIAGSHVIVRCGEKLGGKMPEDDVILEAAEIAAYNSKARDNGKVPVDYTFAKFVKKPAGSKPGMVIFTNNRTIWVNACKK